MLYADWKIQIWVVNFLTLPCYGVVAENTGIIPMLLLTLFHSFFLSLAISLKQLYRNVLQNFAKVMRKQLRWSSSSKGTGSNLSGRVFIKGYFLWQFLKFFRTASFQSNFRRMFWGLALRSPIKTASIWFCWLDKYTPLTSNHKYFVK